MIAQRGQGCIGEAGAMGAQRRCPALPEDQGGLLQASLGLRRRIQMHQITVFHF